MSKKGVKFSFMIEMYDFKIVFADNAKRMGADNDAFAFVTEETHDNEIRILASNLWGDYTDPRFLIGLSHECNHAAMCVLHHRGIKFDYENQETLCYTQDYILGKIIKRLWRIQDEKT